MRHTSHLVWKPSDVICWREQAVVTLCTKGYFCFFYQYVRAAVVWVWGQMVLKICLFGVGFSWFLLLMLSLISAQGLGYKSFNVSGVNFTLPSLPKPWYRLRGRRLLRVLQNCLHCGWVQKTTGALKSRAPPRMLPSSLGLLRHLLFCCVFFIIYFSLGGLCNLHINIFIWLGNCIKIHRNLGASMRRRSLLRRFWFFSY